MNTAQILQILNIYANMAIIIFVVYYFWNFRTKEKELEKKQGKIDADYHQVVDNALTKERKILEDASDEANLIITGAEYISMDSKKTVDHALQKMAVDIHKESADTAKEYMSSYQASLKELATQSLIDLQKTTKELEADLQKQVKEFHESLLPDLKKGLEEYKESRIQQTEQMVTQIVQKVSQEVLNKSIPLEDHQTLLIQSLERAKKEGMFE